MRNSWWAGLGVAAALAAAGSPAGAAITLQFSFFQADPDLTASMTAVIPFAPIYNAFLLPEYITACSEEYLGVARQCAISALLPAPGKFDGLGLPSMADTVGFGLTLTPLTPDLPLVTTNWALLNFFEFPDGALSTPGTYVSGNSDYSLTLTVSGLADIVESAPPSSGGPVPEPASWALLILGFGGIGAALRRRRSHLRAALT